MSGSPSPGGRPAERSEALGSAPDRETPATTASGGVAPPESGAGAAPTWPPRYDSLVERWTQRAPSASTPPDPHPPEHP